MAILEGNLPILAVTTTSYYVFGRHSARCPPNCASHPLMSMSIVSTPSAEYSALCFIGDMYPTQNVSKCLAWKCDLDLYEDARLVYHCANASCIYNCISNISNASPILFHVYPPCALHYIFNRSIVPRLTPLLRTTADWHTAGTE
jgi:hypothetical protein